MDGAIGWVLATGALTFVNQVYTGTTRVAAQAAATGWDSASSQVQGIDYVKIPVATLAGAGVMALISKVSPEIATILAVTAFLTVALTPMNGQPAPVSSVVKIFHRIGVV